MAQWGDKTAGDLVSYLTSAMPPGARGSLPPQSYIDLVAYILDANSAHAGNQPLTTTSSAVLRSVASGARAAYLTGGAPAPSATPANASAPQPKQPPPGITV